jgi:hypothetical protein
MPASPTTSGMLEAFAAIARPKYSHLLSTKFLFEQACSLFG